MSTKVEPKAFKVEVQPEQRGQSIDTYKRDEGGNFQKVGSMDINKISPAELSSEEIGKMNAYDIPDDGLAEVYATGDPRIVTLITSDGPVDVKMDDLAIQNEAQRAEILAESQNLQQQEQFIAANRGVGQPEAAATAPAQPEAKATQENPEVADVSNTLWGAEPPTNVAEAPTQTGPEGDVSKQLWGAEAPTTPTASTEIESGGILARAGEIGPGGYLSDLDRIEVIAWQTELQKAGYDLGPAGIDGKLGKDTMAASRQYVAANNLSENMTLAELGEHSAETALAQAAPAEPAAPEAPAAQQEGVNFAASIDNRSPFNLDQVDVIPTNYELVEAGQGGASFLYADNGINNTLMGGERISGEGTGAFSKFAHADSSVVTQTALEQSANWDAQAKIEQNSNTFAGNNQQDAQQIGDAEARIAALSNNFSGPS